MIDEKRLGRIIWLMITLHTVELVFIICLMFGGLK